MAGVKGRSGRKSWSQEFIAKKASQLSFETIIKVLSAPDDVISLVDKLKAAIPIAQKTMPDKLEVTDMNALTYDDKIALLASLKKLLSAPQVVDIESINPPIDPPLVDP